MELLERVVTRPASCRASPGAENGDLAAKSQPPSPDDRPSALCWALLSNLLLRAPGTKMLNALASAPDPGADTPAERAAQALFGAARNSDVTRLADAHAHLFAALGSPQGDLRAASWCNSDEQVALRQTLREWRLQPKPGASEPPDHLAVLFEALSLLVGDGEHTGARLLTAQLLPWAPCALAVMRVTAQDTPNGAFYVALADLAQALLAEEALSLEELPP